VQESTALTPGAPEAGAPANLVGSVTLAVQLGAPGGPDDSDVLITSSVTDVRCKAGTSPCATANAADGADYAGELRVLLMLRITDRGAGDVAGTVVDTPFAAPMTCASSVSTSTGGTCSLSTSADAIIPGSVPEGERAIWEQGQVEVWDGGPDGAVATTTGDSVFLREGIFVP
jgi:hypothetical protein